MSTCNLCSQDLTVELDPESFDEASSSTVGESTTAPDDLILQCGCHFHFQCLLDESSEIALSLACPACGNSIATNPTGASLSPQVLTQYHNEGGSQSNLNIHPLIIEEAYLTANPAARPARAFMTLCAEGDIPGIIELLQAMSEDPDEDDMTPGELVRWSDPLEEGKSGLHVAVEKERVEVVWLLLWLASSLEAGKFPSEFQQVAAQMGVGRQLFEGTDVRALRDEQERTAGDLARNLRGSRSVLVQSGILDM